MPPTSSIHIPVMSTEVLGLLEPRPGSVVVDGTFGGGGHARLLAERVGEDGLIIACDRDPTVIERATSGQTFSGLPIKIAERSYHQIPDLLQELGQIIPESGVDGILLDLGLSSDQLADDERGFSFTSNGLLDLRFNPEEGEPAFRMLEWIKEEKLADLIFEYGEERYSRRIAREIVKRRATDPIRSASDLTRLVLRSIPSKPQKNGIHPATRTFQALRIAVNDELRHLDVALRCLPKCLAPGGRLAIISFHSLEDRRVKHGFRENLDLEPITRKPVVPTDEEIRQNPRSRSAKLRVAERITDNIGTS